MNHLGMTLVTAAVQVTLAALPAVVVVALSGRRSPRTAAALAFVSLALCVGLTISAFAPPPPWRNWLSDNGPRPIAPTLAFDEQSGAGVSEPAALGVPLRRLLDLLSMSDVAASERQTWSVWAWLALSALLATLLAAVRLIAGLRTIAACRASSRPIRDAALRRLLDELRSAVGCRPRVEVRSSAAIGTAATVGWWRPAILLADDWRSWAADELRAVLAHELAHVRRRDYAAALFASGCRALHYYHPLVAWLAGRLRLHQELAADATAADAVGGRTAYLVALARMALRQERFRVAGAARPFLSDRNSLMRRIAMLRITDDKRPLCSAARWGLAAVLFGAALAASTIRGTAQAPQKTGTESADLPPIDLRYVPEKSDGIFVLRPATLLGRPEMRPLVEKWNGLAAAACRQLGMRVSIDLATIEQVVGPFQLKTMSDEEVTKNGRPERHSVIMGLAMVRMTRDYDWPDFLKSLAPVVDTKELKPGTFECRCPAFGPQPFTVHTPDARTLVLAVPGQPVVKTDSTVERWGAAGKGVERAGYVVLLDNRTGRWTSSLAEEKDFVPVVSVLDSPAHLAFGLHWGDCVRTICTADWENEPTDAAVARGEATIRGIIGAALKAETPQGDTNRLLHGLLSELLTSARVRRDGKVVTVEADSETRWIDLLKAVPLDGKAQAEMKSGEK
jgi:beta-lactamase regulating signal transducer with metallopeptidase domain